MSAVRVRNTFISFDINFDELDEPVLMKRQVSAPLPELRPLCCDDDMDLIKIPKKGDSIPIDNQDDLATPRERGQHSVHCYKDFEQLSVSPTDDIDTCSICTAGHLDDAEVKSSWSESRQTSSSILCKEFEFERSPDSGDEPTTQIHTLMIRNLPTTCPQEALLEEIESAGFRGHYDFFYLPMDKWTGLSRGYAFVNFIESSFALKFRDCFEGRCLKGFKSTKFLAIVPATIQGYDANYMRYSNAQPNQLWNPSFRPMFLRSVVKTGGPLQGFESDRNLQRTLSKESNSSSKQEAAKSNLINVKDNAVAEDLVQLQREFLQRWEMQNCQKLDPQKHCQQVAPAPTTMPKMLLSRGVASRKAESQPKKTIAFCGHCGEKLLGNARRFCTNCGCSIK
eukprot:TRINITY_DN109110_c0_g1_i1.p1 TRINITY_DN109110_c0_g1~~TRINITY_DN109110_c0_g1_i1.p1  ORF type:complete len:456 (-),score=87.07 TRINITY_DN109110_c0_g1_i1:260-1444(-)